MVNGYNALSMKPKDLKVTFKWDERRPYYQDGILFVPKHYQEHRGELLPSMGKPIAIEYCSGNGEWIIDKCEQEPHRHWIAVEKKFQRVAKIWSKAKNRHIENLTIVCGEAETFTKHYLLEGSVEAIFVNFPDPWPKDRHAKHRLIQTPFAKELARIAKPGCKAIFVTDDVPYAEQMEAQMCAPWKLCEKRAMDENYGSSFFDRLWRSKGCAIQLLEFQCK